MPQPTGDASLAHGFHRLAHAKRDKNSLHAQRRDDLSCHEQLQLQGGGRPPGKMSAPSAPPEVSSSSDGSTSESTGHVILVILAIVGVSLKACILFAWCLAFRSTATVVDEADPRPPGPREAFWIWALWKWRHRQRGCVRASAHAPALLIRSVATP